MAVQIFLAFCLFLIGACIGSFINLAAFRIPIQISLIKPRSYCNHCKKILSFKELVPVFGYAFIKGKCTKCGVFVPLEYPLVEAFAGLFFVFGWIYFDPHFLFMYQPYEFLHSTDCIQLVTVLWLFSTGLLLSIIDFKHHILPDVIVIPGIIVNILLGSLNPELGFLQSLLGCLVGGFGLYLISKIYQIIRKREGIGFGDIKYLAFLGALLGWYGVIFTIFLASVLGSIIGIIGLWYQGKNLNTPIPFGPFLAASAVIYFLLSKNFYIL